MNFSRFFSLIETGGLEFGFFGDLQPIVGSGKSETLNYGTGQRYSGKPFLYVPLLRGESSIRAILTSIRNRIAHTGIECSPNPSSFGGWACQAAKTPHKTDIMHTGEAHVTVAIGDSLSPIFGDLKSEEEKVDFLKTLKLSNGTPLFDSYGNGINMPVDIARPGRVVYGVAKSFSNEPLVALLPVVCPRIAEVREALRLPPLPSNYTTHVTIGYAYGVKIGDLLTTNTNQGLSARLKHDADYKKIHGIEEEFLMALGITEILVENISD